MSSIWKQNHSRYWTACFRDASGRQRRISTKETNKAKARKIAEAFEAAARTKHTKLHTARVIARLHEELGGEPINSVSVRAFAQGWLAEKKSEVGPRTFDNYQKSIAKLLNWLGPKADQPIDQIDKPALVGYRTARAAQVGAVTANGDLSIAKMLFLAARRDGVLETNPAEFVDGVRARNGEKTKRAFTLPELRAVFDVADPEWRSMVLFGLYTGQRLSDIASLTWSAIDLSKGELRLTTAKTGKLLILPLAKSLLDHLLTLPSSDDNTQPLHPRAAAVLARNGRSSALSNQFADLLADAGLRPHQSHRSMGKGRDTVRTGNALSFHSLRRTATTLLHEAGVPQQVVQSFIGHDSSEIHQVYVSIGAPALRAAADRLPAL